MSRLDEQLTEQFHRWELRGRGWQVFPEPVEPEPPFVPFTGYYVPATRPRNRPDAVLLGLTNNWPSNSTGGNYADAAGRFFPNPSNQNRPLSRPMAIISQPHDQFPTGLDRPF